MQFKSLCLTVLLATATAAADSPAVALGSKVRVQASGLDGGLRTGVLKKGGECTMVVLDQPTREGYTMLALNALSTLEVARSGAWQAVDLKSLLAKETKDCREADAD
jgi:hypothetical protein